MLISQRQAEQFKRLQQSLTEAESETHESPAEAESETHVTASALYQQLLDATDNPSELERIAAAIKRDADDPVNCYIRGEVDAAIKRYTDISIFGYLSGSKTNAEKEALIYLEKFEPYLLPAQSDILLVLKTSYPNATLAARTAIEQAHETEGQISKRQQELYDEAEKDLNDSVGEFIESHNSILNFGKYFNQTETREKLAFYLKPEFNGIIDQGKKTKLLEIQVQYLRHISPTSGTSEEISALNEKIKEIHEKIEILEKAKAVIPEPPKYTPHESQKPIDTSIAEIDAKVTSYQESVKILAEIATTRKAMFFYNSLLTSTSDESRETIQAVEVDIEKLKAAIILKIQGYFNDKTKHLNAREIANEGLPHKSSEGITVHHNDDDRQLETLYTDFILQHGNAAECNSLLKQLKKDKFSVIENQGIRILKEGTEESPLNALITSTTITPKLTALLNALFIINAKLALTLSNEAVFLLKKDAISLINDFTKQSNNHELNIKLITYKDENFHKSAPVHYNEDILAIEGKKNPIVQKTLLKKIEEYKLKLKLLGSDRDNIDRMDLIVRDFFIALLTYEIKDNASKNISRTNTVKLLLDMCDKYIHGDYLILPFVGLHDAIDSESKKITDAHSKLRNLLEINKKLIKEELKGCKPLELLANDLAREVAVYCLDIKIRIDGNVDHKNLLSEITEKITKAQKWAEEYFQPTRDSSGLIANTPENEDYNKFKAKTKEILFNLTLAKNKAFLNKYINDNISLDTLEEITSESAVYNAILFFRKHDIDGLYKTLNNLEDNNLIDHICQVIINEELIHYEVFFHGEEGESEAWEFEPKNISKLIKIYATASKSAQEKFITDINEKFVLIHRTLTQIINRPTEEPNSKIQESDFYYFWLISALPTDDNEAFKAIKDKFQSLFSHSVIKEFIKKIAANPNDQAIKNAEIFFMLEKATKVLTSKSTEEPPTPKSIRTLGELSLEVENFKFFERALLGSTDIGLAGSALRLAEISMTLREEFFIEADAIEQGTFTSMVQVLPDDHLDVHERATEEDALSQVVITDQDLILETGDFSNQSLEERYFFKLLVAFDQLTNPNEELIKQLEEHKNSFIEDKSIDLPQLIELCESISQDSTLKNDPCITEIHTVRQLMQQHWERVPPSSNAEQLFITSLNNEVKKIAEEHITRLTELSKGFFGSTTAGIKAKAIQNALNNVTAPGGMTTENITELKKEINVQRGKFYTRDSDVVYESENKALQAVIDKINTANAKAQLAYEAHDPLERHKELIKALLTDALSETLDLSVKEKLSLYKEVISLLAIVLKNNSIDLASDYIEEISKILAIKSNKDNLINLIGKDDNLVGQTKIVLNNLVEIYDKNNRTALTTENDESPVAGIQKTISDLENPLKKSKVKELLIKLFELVKIDPENPDFKIKKQVTLLTIFKIANDSTCNFFTIAEEEKNVLIKLITKIEHYLTEDTSLLKNSDVRADLANFRAMLTPAPTIGVIDDDSLAIDVTAFKNQMKNLVQIIYFEQEINKAMEGVRSYVAKIKEKESPSKDDSPKLKIADTLEDEIKICMTLIIAAQKTDDKREIVTLLNTLTVKISSASAGLDETLKDAGATKSREFKRLLTAAEEQMKASPPVAGFDKAMSSMSSTTSLTQNKSQKRDSTLDHSYALATYATSAMAKVSAMFSINSLLKKISKVLLFVFSFTVLPVF